MSCSICAAYSLALPPARPVLDSREGSRESREDPRTKAFSDKHDWLTSAKRYSDDEACMTPVLMDGALDTPTTAIVALDLTVILQAFAVNTL